MAEAKDVADLEKAIDEGKDAVAPVHAMTGGEEQEPLIAADLRVQPIKGGAIARFAAKMNTDLKNWQLYLCWLLLSASVMALTNHIFPDGDNNHAVPDKRLIITPALVEFTVLLGGICLMVRTMKQMM